MALVDLSSDLSKFRSTVKSAGEIKPETSKAKSLRGFAAFQPISEKLSSLSPNINKPKSIDFNQKLTTTNLDDVVKKLKQDLIINSVSKYSPVNASKNQNTIGRVSVEDIVSKFSSIRQEQLVTRLDKSNVLILKAESGTNNNTSPIDVNTLLAKTIDRKSSSPNVFSLSQTDNKSISSPNIVKNTNEEINNITDPETVINRIPLSGEKSGQSPDILPSVMVDNKTESSPDINLSSGVADKSTQSPNVFFDNVDNGITESSPDVLLANNSSDKDGQSPSVNLSSGIIDKSTQSPNVLSNIQSTDRSGESPDVNIPIQSSDRTAQSPTVFSDIQTPDKSETSPNIKAIVGDQTDNITDPKTEVFGKPLFINRQDQSVLINKDWYHR